MEIKLSEYIKEKKIEKNTTATSEFKQIIRKFHPVCLLSIHIYIYIHIKKQIHKIIY